MAKSAEGFKLKGVKQYAGGKRSLGEVAQTDGIDESQLRRWVASYRVHGWSRLAKKHSAHYTAAFKYEVLARLT